MSFALRDFVDRCLSIFLDRYDSRFLALKVLVNKGLLICIPLSLCTAGGHNHKPDSSPNIEIREAPTVRAESDFQQTAGILALCFCTRVR
jgi:hypothetical protein